MQKSRLSRAACRRSLIGAVLLPQSGFSGKADRDAHFSGGGCGPRAIQSERLLGDLPASFHPTQVAGFQMEDILEIVLLECLQ